MRFAPFAVALLLCQAFATPAHAGETPETVASGSPSWAFETSDIEPDPGFVFGRLDNGLRYVVRHNERPEGTALVRLHIGSGSLSETESERGLAHFLEHMAFNGSKRVPEGEMIKLLEREGLAFGADTNASTGFEATTYKLDLPRNDPALLDTALMLMRETASELTLSPEAIDRERGVILAERRDRSGYALEELVDRLDFLTPGALHTQRLPIGLPEVLERATDTDLRGFYAREYVPANAVLVVVGDYPVEAVESAIKRHFADWRPAPLPTEPDIGPIDLARSGETDIFLDPALSEMVTISRLAPWKDLPDSIAARRDNLVRSLGYDIVNRRLARLAAQDDPPFRSAGFGTGDLFEAARTTSLSISTIDGGWQRGLDAAVDTLRTALVHGFSESEVAEQLATTRTALENAVAATETRTNAALAESALTLVEDELIPSSPAASLARFEGFADRMTAEQVLAALLGDAVPLIDPLIRFRGRTAPEGEQALRAAWNAAVARPVGTPVEIEAPPFAYTHFGPPGALASDRTDERIGLRILSYANGVKLNLKTTGLSKDRISFRLHLDGGSLLDTRENPNATAMVNFLTAGGLGAHSQDELTTILAGRTVTFDFGSATDSFRVSGTTTPRDLELQLQLLAALLADPGYRPEGETRFRQTVANFYKTLDATPAAAYSSAIGAILSDDDPRFSLQSEQHVAAQDFDDLKATIGERLTSGAIELSLVGDLDEAAAIDLVARTLGALQTRESDFQPRTENRKRHFTADRSLRTVYHRGESDQATLQLIWPTTDDSDLELNLTMELLERVAQLELQDELRERLGQAYSPDAGNSQSSIYPGYGTFSLTASLDVGQLEIARAAMQHVVQRLRSEATDADTLERARRPLLEQFDNALKSNGGWLSLVDRAQSKPRDVDRFLAGKDRTMQVTPEMIRAAAERFLPDDGAVEIRVLPLPEPEAN